MAPPPGCMGPWQRLHRDTCLAAVAESHGVQWLCYESFRALGHRCAAVFDPDSLSEPTPSLDQTVQTWRCKATRASVMFSSGRESFVWDL